MKLKRLMKKNGRPKVRTAPQSEAPVLDGLQPIRVAEPPRWTAVMVRGCVAFAALAVGGVAIAKPFMSPEAALTSATAPALPAVVEDVSPGGAEAVAVQWVRAWLASGKGPADGRATSEMQSMSLAGLAVEKPRDVGGVAWVLPAGDNVRGKFGDAYVSVGLSNPVPPEAPQEQRAEPGVTALTLAVPVSHDGSRWFVAGSPSWHHQSLPDAAGEVEAQAYAVDRQVSDASKEAVTAALKAWPDAEAAQAAFAPGVRTLALPPGVTFIKLHAWEVLEGGGKEREGIARAEWKIQSGAVLFLTHRVAIRQVGETSDSWRVSHVKANTGGN